jgi:hypothetical protein
MTRPNGSAVSRVAALRGISCLVLLALLAACAGQGSHVSSQREAARYAARARGNYVPPGPPEDPWGPYIHEAGQRFDVPETWIRSVMRVESGGNQYQNGQLITSSAGAMGLMQVMPETYDELHDRYSLGDDAFDPHNNILAGAAYMREMYDIYGSPGFLAAYNAGPRRLDDYLSNNRPLPDETRRYVAMIGPDIVGVYPSSRSPAEDYAMNALPIDIPPGTRYGRATQLASSRGWPSRRGRTRSRTRSNTRWCSRLRHRRRVAGSGSCLRRTRSRCRCVAAGRQPGSGQSRSAPIPTSARRMPHSGPRASTRRVSCRSRTLRYPACTRDIRFCTVRGWLAYRARPRFRRADTSRMAARAAWCCRRRRYSRSAGLDRQSDSLAFVSLPFQRGARLVYVTFAAATRSSGWSSADCGAPAKGGWQR